MRIFSLMTSVDRAFKPHHLLMPLLCVVALFLWGCGGQPPVTKFSGRTMGTYWQVSIAATLTEAEQTSVLAAIEQTLDDVNQSMSTYIDDSEINLFNQADVNVDYPLSHDLLKVVDTALMVSEQTNGRYDITIAPLVNLWGFGPNKTLNAPNEHLIQETLKRVGYESLERINGGLVKHKAGMKIDLSSIAKGYGVDKVAQTLLNLGFEHFLVEIGGEITAYGDKYNQPWRVAIEKPAQGRQIQSIIALQDKHVAIASSGNYRNFIDYDGERAVHTIDPQTGHPVRNTLLATTVIAENCMIADAYATALMVLDKDAPAFANRHDLTAIMIYSNNNDKNNGFTVVHSEQFKRQFGDE